MARTIRSAGVMAASGARKDRKLGILTVHPSEHLNEVDDPVRASTRN